MTEQTTLPQKSAAAEATGSLVIATLPGDNPGPAATWAESLRAQGHEVDHLGLRAPAIAADHAVEREADALLIPVTRTAVQSGVQALVAHLQRRGAQTPVLVTGDGVDADFAQWVAIPQGSTPYWGGVYYCEDATEAEQVLKQIVLFTPPPPEHSHDHDHGAATDREDADACATGSCCTGCPLSGGACDEEPL